MSSGTGDPVVFSHGWPLSADAWESQMVCRGTPLQDRVQF